MNERKHRAKSLQAAMEDYPMKGAKVRKKKATPKCERQTLLYGSVYCENCFKEAHWRDSKGS